MRSTNAVTRTGTRALQKGFVGAVGDVADASGDRDRSGARDGASQLWSRRVALQVPGVGIVEQPDCQGVADGPAGGVGTDDRGRVGVAP
ncbi:hypothetical protein [Streptomyces sp. NPDC000880]